MAELEENKAPQKVTKEKKKEVEKSIGLTKEDLEPLLKFGRFAILKNTIRTFAGNAGEQRAGLENMDPDKPARKEIFLKDSEWEKGRRELKIRLQLWRSFLSDLKDFDIILSKAIEKSETVSNLKKKNLKIAIEAAREFEKSYRTVAAFFTNAEKSKGAKVENIDFMNAELDQINDRDNPRFLEEIGKQLEAFYNRLDLMDNYSLLVIPGFLRSAENVDRVAEVAARNKVTLVTDFDDVESVEEAMLMLDKFKLTSADLHKAYVCMTCNYVVGRPGYEDLDEPVLFIPPSAALAGLMYSNPTQQVSAGVKDGRLKETDGVRFPIKQTELGELVDRNVIPMTYDFGKAMAFGATTLFDGDNPGLKTYSVIRTFDFISKTLKDLLNRYTFRNITQNMKEDIRRQIIRFLQDNKGHGKLIEKFEIKSIEKIGVDKIRLNIHIIPWFPARLFELNLTGIEGEETNEWDESVAPV